MTESPSDSRRRFIRLAIWSTAKSEEWNREPSNPAPRSEVEAQRGPLRACKPTERVRPRHNNKEAARSKMSGGAITAAAHATGSRGLPYNKLPGNPPLRLPVATVHPPAACCRSRHSQSGNRAAPSRIRCNNKRSRRSPRHPRQSGQRTKRPICSGILS